MLNVNKYDVSPQCFKHGRLCKDYARKTVIKHLYEPREHFPFREGLSDWIMLPKDCGPSSVVFSDIIMLQRCLNDIIMSLNSIYMLVKVFNNIIMNVTKVLE